MVGSGNVAWHLAPELENRGHKILEVYSPTPEHALALQKRLYNAEILTSPDFSNSEAEVLILAISDDAIETVAQEIALSDDVVIVHTSGSQPISKLGYTATENIGVFYPLQTFTKSKPVTFEDIPILIEAENKFTTSVLRDLGESLSKYVFDVNSRDRFFIHLAAVFACNFTNYLFSISENILNDHGFDFQLLRPLIAETMNKSLDIGPIPAQTGPAVRKDQEIMDQHMLMLENSGYEEIYQLLSHHIMKRFE